MKSFEREVVIIGAGPAGLSAAIEAKKAGCEVLVIDENKQIGGQLYKQIHKFFGSSAHYAGMRGFEIAKALSDKAAELGVEFWLDSVALGIFSDSVWAVKDGKAVTVMAQKIIVAAGSTENPVAFEGSTLPGILTAGAVQTMMNIYRVRPGKKAVVLGSGNVGLIVAYQLLQAGVEVAAVVEKKEKIGGYGVHAAKLTRAGVPVITSATVTKAEGSDCLRSVTVEKDGTETVIECDTLCIAAGMSPMSELLWQAGAEFDYEAELGGFVPVHDCCMKTSVPGIYVAGDAAGVEEAPIAMEEGIIAGISVAESLGKLEKSVSDAARDEAAKRIAALESGENGELRKAARYAQMAAMKSC
ncbi:MAG: FAD-dependent oxidoreductase [Oscillospiraceae bacterium]|nr:FAD-dependent oxidoreductase [Oscillospiraceae bacterium]